MNAINDRHSPVHMLMTHSAWTSSPLHCACLPLSLLQAFALSPGLVARHPAHLNGIPAPSAPLPIPLRRYTSLTAPHRLVGTATPVTGPLSPPHSPLLRSCADRPGFDIIVITLRSLLEVATQRRASVRAGAQPSGSIPGGDSPSQSRAQSLPEPQEPRPPLLPSARSSVESQRIGRGSPAPASRRPSGEPRPPGSAPPLPQQPR